MQVYRAYFDAAGHPRDKAAVVVCGYATTVHRWDKFEVRWTQTLRAAGIHVPFHMTDFMANAAGFEGWRGRDAEKEALVMRLARLVRRTVHHSFAEAVLLADWLEVNEVYALEENHCHPYGLAAYLVMDKAMRWLQRAHPDVVFDRFIFEDGDFHKGDFIWIMQNVIKLKRQLLESLSPKFESRSLASLQACDFVAWEHLALINRRLGAPHADAPTIRAAFKELSKVPKSWGYLDAKMLTQYCQRFNVPKRGENRLWGGVARDAKPPRHGQFRASRRSSRAPLG